MRKFFLIRHFLHDVLTAEFIFFFFVHDMIIHELVANVFFVGMVFHVIKIWLETSASASTIRRHALFVLIDAMFVVLVLLRVWWTYIPFALFLVQQWWSHGQDIYEKALREKDVDWTSVLTIVALTFAWIALTMQ